MSEGPTVLALPDPPLADEVVRLREPAARDLAAVVAACQDPMVQRYTRVPTPYEEADGRAFIGGAAGRRILGQSLELVIADRGDDRLRGMIGLIADRHDALRAEIGYWVAPEDRGDGVATRALALLSRWSVTDGGFERLDLQAATANIASLRVAERCGFVREGVLRRAWYRGGGRTDMVLFSLVPEDMGAFPPK
ncbi:MAG TPA: GNAT family protein [Miltoncostaeaceae bacterium]|nr:GNAT family protein [Miltoncostaeaceae bacterium]